VTEEPIEERDTPMSPQGKLVAGAVAALLLVAGAWLMLRVSSPAIVSGQTPPPGHYAIECGFCHAILAEPAAEGS
jgi:hypothetical protein